jgi:hypothetical protein
VWTTNESKYFVAGSDGVNARGMGVVEKAGSVMGKNGFGLKRNASLESESEVMIVGVRPFFRAMLSVSLTLPGFAFSKSTWS